MAITYPHVAFPLMGILEFREDNLAITKEVLRLGDRIGQEDIRLRGSLIKTIT